MILTGHKLWSNTREDLISYAPPVHSVSQYSMIPPIAALVSIEMIRDGGSLAAQFVGTNGSGYELHFGLIQESEETAGFVRVGYAPPVVYERLEIRQDNRFEWRRIDQIEVSWEHASVLLHQLRSHLRNEEHRKWLETMEEVANTHGQLPDSIPILLGPARRLFDDTAP